MERVGLDVPADEDETRAVILVRPRVEMDGRVDDMLDAVQEDRAGCADVQQALHAQNVVPAALEQHRQPDSEGGPVELLVEVEDGGCDPVVRVGPVYVDLTRVALRPAEEAVRL